MPCIVSKIDGASGNMITEPFKIAGFGLDVAVDSEGRRYRKLYVDELPQYGTNKLVTTITVDDGGIKLVMQETYKKPGKEHAEKRTIEQVVKPAKFLRWWIVDTLSPIQDKGAFARTQTLKDEKSIERYVDVFNKTYRSEYFPSNLTVTDYNDRNRLIYAYRAWSGNTIGSSCMRCGTPNPNKELRVRNEEDYHEMLSDHLEVLENNRTVLLHADDGTVLARALLRDTFVDGEKVGLVLDRTYYSEEPKGLELIRRVNEMFKGEIIADRGHYSRNSENNLKFHRSEFQKEYIYTPIIPNSSGRMMAFQDTFQYHDRGTNRGYTKQAKDHGLRENHYQERWDAKCRHCNKILIRGNDGRILDSNSAIRISENTYVCSEECATAVGYRKCESCGHWEGSSSYTTSDGHFYCSSSCARDGGYVRCNYCNDWHKVQFDNNGKPDIGRQAGNWYCSDKCFLAAGWRECAHCGRVYRSGNTVFKHSKAFLKKDENGHQVYDADGYKAYTHYCSEECTSAEGWVKCKKCKDWHKADQPVFKIRGNKTVFCSPDCPEASGWRKCEKCGDLIPPKKIVEIRDYYDISTIYHFHPNCLDERVDVDFRARFSNHIGMYLTYRPDRRQAQAR